MAGKENGGGGGKTSRDQLSDKLLEAILSGDEEALAGISEGKSTKKKRAPRAGSGSPNGAFYDPDVCSFCGREEIHVDFMIHGLHANICGDCLLNCMDMAAKHGVPMQLPSHGDEPAPSRRGRKTPAGPKAKLAVPAPRKIKEFLDQYISGQEKTKRELAVAVHNQYRRITDSKPPAGFEDVELEKSNVLLIGPTGSGKTLFARTLARMLDVPFAIADATTLTEAGYVGDDVENILLNLIQDADMDVERAEHGIIYVDEIDKIGRRTENVAITRDVSGEGVQQALLKILEGTEAHVPPHGGRKHPQAETIKINTENILFILGGAFVGLDDIIRNRMGRSVVGFVGGRAAAGKTGEDLLERVQPEDLVKFGLIPEFVGRLPVISRLSELTEADMVRILTEPRNCITKQYRKLLAMEGVELTFEDDALKAIAALALKRKTGARGLRATIESLMLDIMFDAPERGGGKISITRQMVDKLAEEQRAK